MTVNAPFRFDQVRYLAAKRTVDDRGLNRHVWQRLLDELPTSGADRPLALVELGGGIGTMVERLWDWGLFDRIGRGAAGPGPVAVRYDLVDNHAPSVAAARERLPETARARGWRVAEAGDRLRCTGVDGRVELTIRVVEAPVDAFLADRSESADSVDLVLAHAFLDLFDLDEILRPVLGLLRPGGLCWATVTFDGETIFEPDGGEQADRRVRERYHRSMDERTIGGHRSGDARAGRHLYHRLTAAGAEVLDLGSSDWVVIPRAGGYPDDEAYFLGCILATVETALAGDDAMPAAELAEWLARRRAQLDKGELVYLAHQLDVLARRPAASPGLPGRPGADAPG